MFFKVISFIWQQKGNWCEAKVFRKEPLKSTENNTKYVLFGKMLSIIINWILIILTSINGYLLTKDFLVLIIPMSWSLRAKPYHKMWPSPGWLVSLYPHLSITYYTVSNSLLQWFVFMNRTLFFFFFSFDYLLNDS